ncbi:type II toxin-antitoxin system RelE/ParE family toxin [Aeromonas rivipollensis]|uniref:type II toxin-antitoxin system RelE/ParE family toxin n=1 Tax=Aeromonas rivipollensis TaxID=948519 RepID=UPI003D21578E
MMLQVRVTATALSCLQDIEVFDGGHSGAEHAAALVETLLTEAIAAISANSLLYRQCPSTADYGLNVRERIDQKGYRVLYSVQPDAAYILLVLHQRQSIEDALYRHLILRQ